MSKLVQNFSFPYSLTEKVVENLRIVTRQVGFLQVEGVATLNPNYSVIELEERFEIDIDFVKWHGNDIKPVLELTDLMDDIHTAAMRHACSLNFFTTVNAN